MIQAKPNETIPEKPKRGRKSKYPFHSMNVLDSFVYNKMSPQNYVNASSLCSQHNLRYAGEKKFEVRREKRNSSEVILIYRTN